MWASKLKLIPVKTEVFLDSRNAKEEIARFEFQPVLDGVVLPLKKEVCSACLFLI